MSSPEVLSSADWAWLLRIAVKAGEPIPLEFWLLYHCNTLLPMKREAANPEPAGAQR